MSLIRLGTLLFLLSASLHSAAQTDTAINAVQKTDSLITTLQNLPKKYLTAIDNKLDQYTNRITNKTEKTLTKLARWEAKIKTLLEKASPQTAQQLFSNTQLTFAAALEKYKRGEAILNNQRAKYNEYRDKLTTSVNYLDEQKQYLNTKLLQPLKNVQGKVKEFETLQNDADQMEQFIKERKKQLLDQSLQYIGKSKYLQKINKEAYYYVETLRNYKEIFSDKKKAEQTALTILNKIPAFTKFMQQNSMLAQLFGPPSPSGGIGGASLAGLQTRASVNSLIQNQIAAGGPNAAQQMQQNIQAAQNELSKLKDKVLKAGGSSSDIEMPDFKANPEKTKTFLQRLEFGTNLQSTKGNSYLPSAANLGLSIGYKINDKSIIGIGASYKVGMGSINRISITNQGIGLRSFIDWKLKKQFFISGGYEMNHSAQFKNIQQLQQYNAWQQSGLIGMSKKIAFSSPAGGARGGLTKFFKGTKLQLLYDMLARQHVPVSQPVVFRVGYNF